MLFLETSKSLKMQDNNPIVPADHVHAPDSQLQIELDYANALL